MDTDEYIWAVIEPTRDNPAQPTVEHVFTSEREAEEYIEQVAEWWAAADVAYCDRARIAAVQADFNRSAQPEVVG